MISGNIYKNKKIINALVEFHRTQEMPDLENIPGVSLKDDFIKIDYGTCGEVFGSVFLEKRHFNIVKITSPDGDLNISPNYQHSYDGLIAPDFIGALTNSDLSQNPQHFSAIVTAISESARSRLVGRIVESIYACPKLAPEDLSSWLSLLYNNYNNTSEFIGQDINETSRDWKRLSYSDYESYFRNENNENNQNTLELIKRHVDKLRTLVNGRITLLHEYSGDPEESLTHILSIASAPEPSELTSGNLQHHLGAFGGIMLDPIARLNKVDELQQRQTPPTS